MLAKCFCNTISFLLETKALEIDLAYIAASSDYIFIQMLIVSGVSCPNHQVSRIISQGIPKRDLKAIMDMVSHPCRDLNSILMNLGQMEKKS